MTGHLVDLYSLRKERYLEKGNALDEGNPYFCSYNRLAFDSS